MSQRTAVITGGARGFGKAFGMALASRGLDVVLVDRDAEQVEVVAAALRNQGHRALGLARDVTDDPAIQDIVAQAAAINGGIDILINNAGLHSEEYSRPMQAMGAAKTRRLFEVNVIALVACTLAAKPFMTGRPGASILNSASAAAYPSSTAYGASKLAAAGLTIAFAQEFGPTASASTPSPRA